MLNFLGKLSEASYSDKSLLLYVELLPEGSQLCCLKVFDYVSGSDDEVQAQVRERWAPGKSRELLLSLGFLTVGSYRWHETVTQIHPYGSHPL